MRKLILLALATASFMSPLIGQRACASFEYPATGSALAALPRLYQQQAEGTPGNNQQIIVKGEGVITIPVVVHILYNQSSENISDELVIRQLALLNQCFRRLNADTINTPSRFKSAAADCEIEFKLAISDPLRRATSGIVRKYTPVAAWGADDQVKYTLKGGDDAWDTRNYLNIWICNLNKTLGYASFPGGPEEKDGMVLDFSAVGNTKKTAVHEAGHWLGLKHIWGDTYCGDDGVDDTPKQGNFTGGCPSGIRSSCSNGADGDMYMNYMDLTDDACINLFTKGQKTKMRSLFNAGGLRSALPASEAFKQPLTNEIPVPEEMPKWLSAHVYPNPVIDELTFDFSGDVRWVGKTIRIIDLQGQVRMHIVANAKVMKVNLGGLKTGIYFIAAKKEDGSSIKQKIVKL